MVFIYNVQEILTEQRNYEPLGAHSATEWSPTAYTTYLNCINVQKILERNLNQYAKKSGATTPNLKMVGQVLPGSRKGPVAGFGWTCWNTNILISWISTMRTKMICVRPQWLGFWKQFYRQEDLTCHLHTRNPLQSLTHAQANWSGTSWLTYRQTYHRTYRSSECWMLPLVHMHTLAVNFDIFICGRKYTYSATNRGCFF